jgi:flagellar biosynthesis/type III secretory pathway protein FliH
MTKGKKVTIKMDPRQAAAVRQALFESTKGFTYDPSCTPARVIDIRTVITDIDSNLDSILGEE